MNKYKILSIYVALGSVFSLGVLADTYQWKDDKGVTQIDQSVPPEYANRVIKHLDSKGHVVQDKKPEAGANALEAKTADQQAVVEQRRKDKALLNTYSNEKEIDLARDRNLRLVDARIKNIQEMQKSAQEDLDGFRKEAKGIGAGKAIPASVQADISAAENRIAKLKQDMDAANAKAVSVKAVFEADKARYRELIGGTNK